MRMHSETSELEFTARDAGAVRAYDAAMAAFFEYRLSTADHVKAALDADPDFVMGLCFRAYLLMQLGSRQIYPKVDSILEPLKALYGAANPRERTHIEALGHWREGRTDAACRSWESILIAAPCDLLALRLHHLMCFWRGHRECLRAAPAAVLGRIAENTPGYGNVLGMLSFGLEECGDYLRAEPLGRRAQDLNPEDLWALHAVAHVMEMQGRHEEGREWLERPFGIWADRNPFKDHIWWHAALFALEEGDDERVLDIYEHEVRIDRVGFYLDVQNAASLLMRLVLLGVDVGGRWAELAELAEARTGDNVLPFTDLHFMMSLTGAGRREAAARYLASLESFAGGQTGDAAATTASLGVPVAAALLSHAKGEYGKCADLLFPLRHAFGPLGGSHAQQDILHQILIDAAIRDGRRDLAGSLLAERASLRPGGRWTRERIDSIH